MMKHFILVGMMALVSPFAMAEEHHDGPCAADREKLCAGVQPGEGRIMKCMKENEAKLSSECKSWREKKKGEMKEVREACHEDVEKLCGEVTPGHGAIKKCLHENKEKVSEGCKAEMKDMKEMHKAHKKGK